MRHNFYNILFWKKYTCSIYVNIIIMIREINFYEKYSRHH